MVKRAERKPETIAAVHLDAVGGVAGDMFAAALLDCRPDLWPACERAISAVGLPDGARASLAGHGDGVLDRIAVRRRRSPGGAAMATM